MIFRLTQKLGKKIKVSPSLCLAKDINPYADWTANLFRVEHVQYIILTNTASLYSVVMFGRGITDDDKFVKYSLECIREYMTYDGMEYIYHRHIVPGTQTISFSKTGDRRVLGSMNDLIFSAKVCMIEQGKSPFDVSWVLNEIPLSMINYGYPKRAFLAMLHGE